jgi:hypothetical protein
MATKTGLPIPVYSIFDRDIPLAHIRACISVNPIGPTENRREAHEKTVGGCEGGSCLILPREDTANGEAS